MLTAYRRHGPKCLHRQEGRKYRRCRCPIWADGFLNGVEMRESLKTRDWEKAQTKIRDLESKGTISEPDPEYVHVEEACETFTKDAEARNLSDATLSKYKVLFDQLQAFAKDQGFRVLKELDLNALRMFRAGWKDGSLSALKKLERLRAFFRFAQESSWIETNPALKVKNPKLTDLPTLPFSREDMIAILAAADRYPDNYGTWGGPDAKRLRALILLLRYSGMRIGDGVSCEIHRLQGERLFLYTAKTGVPVNCKLPPSVVEALNSAPRANERYFFWTGEGKLTTATGNWRRAMAKLFILAGVEGGHPHRFRDTFAVELLLAGIPLDRVSILLGHRSIKVTEQHYAPWIRARQEQLEADLERSWSFDPIILAETKGTKKVQRPTERPN
jgi:integrase/recombinase XerD